MAKAYRALVCSSAWQELFHDEHIQNKIAQIERSLRSEAARDPYTLGRLQAQLELLDWLKEKFPARLGGEVGEDHEDELKAAAAGLPPRVRLV